MKEGEDCCEGRVQIEGTKKIVVKGGADRSGERETVMGGGSRL